MFLFRLGIIAFFAIISLRLYQLQVREGQSYNAQADENRFQIVETSAPRGVIYDKQTTILTRNRPSFEIALIPENIPEDDLDTTLRPQRLEGFVGQAQARANLRIFIEAARARGQTLDHVLFVGPPGLGQTTLAPIVAR